MICGLFDPRLVWAHGCRAALGAALICGIGAVGSARAGEFAILPLRVDLSAQQRAAQIVIRNDDQAPLRMQLRALRWRQDDAGRDVYEPAEELIFFPRAVEVPAGESRIVRLGIRAAAGSIEDSYRLFIAELPPLATDPRAAAGATVQVVLEIGVPVFIAPLQPRQKIDVEDLRIRDGVAHWVVRNAGNVHLRAERIELVGTDAAGTVLFSAPVSERYVLAGVARPMQLEVPAAVCARLAALGVVVSAERLQVEQSINVVATSCR
jgi:fimbrial chaperone protein